MLKIKFKKYAIAFVIALAILTTFTLYASWQRSKFPDLGSLNNSFGNTAILLLILVMLIGPLSRLYQIFDKSLMYRKELGIMAFFSALLHGLISLFFLPQRFPLGDYLDERLQSFLFGLASLVLLTYLYFVSFEQIKKLMGMSWWWWLQNWGVRLATALAALHLFVMRIASWKRWFFLEPYTGSPFPDEFPSLHLLLFYLLVYLVILRVTELFGTKIAKFVTNWFTVLLISTILATFIWPYLKVIIN